MKGLVDRFATFVVNYRFLILLIAIIAIVLSGYGKQHLTVKNSYRIWFDKDDPDLAAFDQLHKTYTRAENVLFVLRPKVAAFSRRIHFLV